MRVGSKTVVYVRARNQGMDGLVCICENVFSMRRAW